MPFFVKFSQKNLIFIAHYIKVVYTALKMVILMKLSSREILKKLRKRIEQLKTDDRFLSEAVLCKEFGISRMTANKINNQLVGEGFLYRIKGSGTYVKSPKAAQQPIRFLLPCPDYFRFDCTYDIRLLMAGMLKEAQKSGIRIQGVPVSSVNNPQEIDWDELEDFNSETTVVVAGFWFKEVFPFLCERKCKVIFCDFHTSDDAKAYPFFFKNWTILRLDAQKAMIKTVDMLAEKSFKRIGYVYNVYFEDSPLMTGFRKGMLKNSLPLTKDNLIYSGNIDDYYDRVQAASENFDVLILSSPDLVRQTLMILQSSGQKVPDDIALICFGDKQNFVNLNPPLSALSIPFYRVGQTIAAGLREGELENTEFETEFFIRESLKAGAGKNINTACIMDSQEEVDKSNQFNFFAS